MFAHMLKIEIDGHFRGSGNVPKPWVAEITGTCPKYGLQRQFVDRLNDWTHAHRAWSGNLYGRVAHFPLREGKLYEVSRCRGSSSKRYVAREFIRVAGRKRVKLEPEQALAIADGGEESARFSVLEGDETDPSWVARVARLGTPDKLGFVVVDNHRLYRLPDGLYEVLERGSQSYVGVRNQQVQRLNHKEALAWLTR